MEITNIVLHVRAKLKMFTLQPLFLVTVSIPYLTLLLLVYFMNTYYKEFL